MVDVDDEVADLEVAEVGEERAAPRSGGARAARRSSSKTSVSAKICSAASGRRNPRDRHAGRDEHRGGVRHLGARLHAVALVRVDEDGNGDQLVVAQQLDRALGAARRGGDEQDGLARLPRRA